MRNYPAPAKGEHVESRDDQGQKSQETGPQGVNPPSIASSKREKGPRGREKGVREKTEVVGTTGALPWQRQHKYAKMYSA